MSIKTFLALASALFAAAALAQAPLGTVDSVNGIVTLTDGTVGGTAVPGKTITNGMRFVATSNGSAVLRLNNGCVLNLRPNQAVTVLQNMTCSQLTAAVQTLGTNVAGGSMGAGALATGGLVVGALAFNSVFVGSQKSISSR